MLAALEVLEVLLKHPHLALYRELSYPEQIYKTYIYANLSLVCSVSGLQSSRMGAKRDHSWVAEADGCSDRKPSGTNAA